MDKKTRAILMTAIRDVAESADWSGPVRANELARRVLAKHPETRDEIALHALTSIAHRWLASPVKDARQGLLFDEFPEVRRLLPVKGAWVDPNWATLAHWEGFEARLEAKRSKAGERSKEAVQEVKTVKRIVRIVRWYGRGDPAVTTEEAMKRRAQFLESRKRKRVRR